MNSRERILTALQHREPDRVPIDLGGTDFTSICKGAYIDLMRYLGREPGEIVLVNIVEQLPALDEAFLDEVIRADTRQVRERGSSRWTLQIEDQGEYLSYVNEWLIRLRMPKRCGHYFDLVEFPIKEPTREALETFPWPDPSDPARWEGLEAEARRLYENTTYALVVGCVFGGGIFEFPQYLRGMEAFLTDLLLHPGFADELMERITEILIEAYSRMLEKVGPYVQVVSVCDDLATQIGPMISPQLYRERIKPRQKRLIEAIKAHTRAYVLYHGCGAAREFLPDLIEIGVDIFNPVQVSARGLEDTADLKRTFGRDLVFWGGVCDTQHMLPFGTPEQVRDETRRRLDDLMPGGGFVAAPVHNIQDGVPPENIMAMFETIHEYGVY
ncbi:MAG: uroporphyrinogen decarboxylase family protein [Anaerolineae bacterium]